jgi:hypothetical protein
LVVAPFAEIEKRCGTFDLDPAIKKLSHPIIPILMEIGAWNVVQAMQTNPFFLFDQFIAANHA